MCTYMLSHALEHTWAIERNLGPLSLRNCFVLSLPSSYPLVCLSGWLAVRLQSPPRFPKKLLYLPKSHNFQGDVLEVLPAPAWKEFELLVHTVGFPEETIFSNC